jgi:hypothetical protein
MIFETEITFLVTITIYDNNSNRSQDETLTMNKSWEYKIFICFNRN